MSEIGWLAADRPLAERLTIHSTRLPVRTYRPDERFRMRYKVIATISICLSGISLTWLAMIAIKTWLLSHSLMGPAITVTEKGHLFLAGLVAVFLASAATFSVALRVLMARRRTGANVRQ
jgi:cytochrome b subunit of formate dehydrogenase